MDEFELDYRLLIAGMVLAASAVGEGPMISADDALDIGDDLIGTLINRRKLERERGQRVT